MKRTLAAAVAGGALLAGGVALHEFPAWEELPDPHRGVHKDVFPQLDYKTLAPGTRIDRVYAQFGRESPARGDQDPGSHCIILRYDAELYDGALAVLIRNSVVQERWLVEDTRVPTECAGLKVDLVDLTGWYAASIRQ